MALSQANRLTQRLNERATAQNEQVEVIRGSSNQQLDLIDGRIKVGNRVIFGEGNEIRSKLVEATIRILPVSFVQTQKSLHLRSFREKTDCYTNVVKKARYLLVY